MKNKNSFQNAMNAVVRIHVKGVTEQNPKAVLDPRTYIQEDWVGTGFFINLNKDEGFILTNGHVAKNALHIEIRSVLTSDEPFKVELIGLIENLDPDVALLKLSKEELTRFKKLAKIKKLPILDFADSENIKRGEEIKAIGYPLGMVEPNMSGGEVTNFISGSLDSVARIVTDAAINPGNSGGPAILKNSKVIGLNTSIVYEASNIAFITPIHIVKKILPLLLKGKNVKPIRLGAYFQKNSSMNSLYLKQKSVKGIIINRVLPNSLASSAKLKTNDILLAINGNELDRHGNIIGNKYLHKKNFFDILHACCIGETIKFKIWRKSKELILSASIKEYKEEIIPSNPIVLKRKSLIFEGLVLQETCSEILDAIFNVYDIDGAILYADFLQAKSKIIITHIDDETQSYELDFHVGDYITHINNTAVATISDFNKVMNKVVKKSSKVTLKTSCGSIGFFELSK